MRINIRCCCNPKRLLGTVECYPVRPGDDVPLPVGPPPIPSLDVSMVDPAVDLPKVLVLRAAMVYQPPELMTPGAEELALKSNETPLERLRQVVGFEEIDRDWPIGEPYAPRAE